MTAKKMLEDNEYEDVVIFENPSYDTALVGVDEDNRAIYDFDKMVEWVCKKCGCSSDEAIEFVYFNTIGSLGRTGKSAPIIMYRLN